MNYRWGNLGLPVMHFDNDDGDNTMSQYLLSSELSKN